MALEKVNCSSDGFISSMGKKGGVQWNRQNMVQTFFGVLGFVQGVPKLFAPKFSNF